MLCWKTSPLDVRSHQWGNLIAISFKRIGTMNLVIQTPRSEVTVLSRSENMKIQRLVGVLCSGNACLLLTSVPLVLMVSWSLIGVIGVCIGITHRVRCHW